MAVKEGNEGIMGGLQEMWDGAGDSAVVVHRDDVD